jgi:hypothetical protein
MSGACLPSLKTDHAQNEKREHTSIGIASVFSFFIGLDQIADDFQDKQDRSFLSIQNASWGL